MKVFNQHIQKRIVSILLLAFIVTNLLYLFLIEPKLIQNNPILLPIYIIIIGVSVILWIFRNRIPNNGFILYFIIALCFTGITNVLFVSNFLGYFWCICAFIIAPFTQSQKIAFRIWLPIISLVFIAGIIAKLEIFNFSPDSNLIKSSWLLWVEQNVIYMLLSGTILYIISSLRSYINNIVSDADQERTKYKPLFEQTYSFITMLDNKGIIIESNQAALYYIRKTNKDICGKFFVDTAWWNNSIDNRNLVLKNLEAAMNGDFRRFEASHTSIDNETDYFDYTLKPIFDSNYSITNIIVEARNITDIKKTKEALIEGEERLLALTESTYEGIVITYNGVCVEFNSAVVAMFRSEPSEIMGINIVEKYIVPEDHEKVYNSIKANNLKPYEARGIRKDGSIIPIEIQGQKIFYKGKEHRVSAIRDLTERNLAQEALVQSEEKYRLITENINDTVCKLDKKLRFSYVSSSVFNMLGYTVGEMMELSIKDITTKDSFRKLVSILNKRKKLVAHSEPESLPSISIEIVLKRKSGQLIWANISAKMVTYSDNNDLEILCVARNVDAMKKIQFSLEENKKNLIAQNEQYEQLNSELTIVNKKLLEAKHKAEESDRLKSAFLANMSHEIRTPMNSIIGFSKMLKAVGIDDDKRNKYADFVVNNGIQLLNIVNDVLDLSKIESNQIQLKKSSFNLNILLDEIYSDLSKSNTKGLMIGISKDFPDSDSYIFTDKNRLVQVLRNLIDNAYKFTRKGGIRFGYDVLNDNIIFFIEDTGIGISIEHQQKIFERFRQVELDPSRVFGGAGLGLSISQKLVELMGGKIWLKSKAGSGATFYFSIPFVKSPLVINNNEQQQAHTKASIKTKKQKIVLVAEDDESNFFFLKELLALDSLKVLHAINGEEAVKMALNTDKLDLILMDIKMPKMDGLEATRRIKALKPSLPIIAQTAFAMSNDKDNAIKSGCDDYITKPINQDILYQVINKYLKKE